MKMKGRYSCILRLKTSPANFQHVLEEILGSLPFMAESVYCFFHEFKKPPDKQIKFDREYLLQNISTQEMTGIASMSIYDANYRSDRVTPFLRISVDPKESDSSVSIQWISFNNLDFLIEKDWVIQQFVDEKSSLSFCYLYDQDDTYKQSKKVESWLRKNWGKRIIHKGIHFQAAPVMYFGKEFEPHINWSNLEQIGVNLNGDIIKVQLGDLYADPESYRSDQKQFWNKMKLDSILKEYQKKTKQDTEQFLKRRIELSRNKS